jgi:transposase InsO family protein
VDHYGQWGPEVLRHWAVREGLGAWSPGTIARAIADLAPAEEVRNKPKRYEIMAPMVMWSEDGTAFRERGRKKELLVLQDECARFKINWSLASGPADAPAVVSYLREAFETYGAPLVLKHDGGAIFHDERVQELLDRHGVIELTSPPGYPPFNGKKERSMRDIKSYERALRRNGRGKTLTERIDMTMKDLNEERPRPVLDGRTAWEIMRKDGIKLPERIRFRLAVLTHQTELEAQAGSRRAFQAARRMAVIWVLMRYNLLNWGGGVSTDYQRKCGTY